jgi:hypothetical protein
LVRIGRSRSSIVIPSRYAQAVRIEYVLANR